MFCSDRITRNCQMNTLVQSVEINDCSYTKGREKINYSLYRDHKLFLNEDWFEVVKVNYAIASISIFRIDDKIR